MNKQVIPNENDKLQGKFFIEGTITAETGLYIGGSKSSLNIGDIDLNVIKNPDGKPYIPGSSLKGKLRSILGKIEGCESVEKDLPYIKAIFGDSGDQVKKQTLAIFRDCLWKKPENFDTWGIEMDYTESKWETAIDRVKGSARQGSLRQIERVPAGSQFDLSIVVDFMSKTPFDITKKIDKEKYEQLQKILSGPKEIVDKNEEIFTYLIALRRGLALIEDDFIGGHGSRGYGRVKINVEKIYYKSLADYLKKENSEIEAKTDLMWINDLIVSKSK